MTKNMSRPYCYANGFLPGVQIIVIAAIGAGLPKKRAVAIVYGNCLSVMETDAEE
jgi:hypothetical protein